MDFFEWVRHNFGEDFDLHGLSDEEYWELEDIYNGQDEVLEKYEKEVIKNTP